MGANLNFDATGVKPSTPNEPIPAAWYRAHITASEVKPSGNGKGNGLNLEFTVLEGDYKDRKIFAWLNIQHESTKAQEIAQRDLSAICHAVGVLRLSNSSQLHHIPLMVKVTIKQEAGRDPQNEIKGYKSANASNLVSSANPAPPAAGARADSPPWANRAATG